jgi:hypothetical protein
MGGLCLSGTGVRLTRISLAGPIELRAGQPVSIPRPTEMRTLTCAKVIQLGRLSFYSRTTGAIR